MPSYRKKIGVNWILAVPEPVEGPAPCVIVGLDPTISYSIGFSIPSLNNIKSLSFKK